MAAAVDGLRPSRAFRRTARPAG